MGLAMSFGISTYAQSLQEGIKFVHYGRYESAVKALSAQAGEEAAYYLGLAELGRDNKTAAGAAFNKVATSFYGMAGNAQILFHEGKKSDAMKLLQEIVDGAKRKEWEKYKIAADAINYTKGGDINKAIEWYKKAVEIAPNEPAIKVALGDAYLKLQTGGGEAMTNYEEALAKTNDKSLVYSKIGSLWYQARNYERALENYEHAKNADPQNPMPYKDLADAYYRINKFELAKQNTEKYLALSDKTVDDQVQYANLLFLSKHYKEAETKMNEVMKVATKKSYMYRVLGYSQYETKDYTNALSSMQQFFKMDKDNTGIISSDYLYTGRIFTALAATDSSKAAAYADSAGVYFEKGLAVDTSANKTEAYREIAVMFRDAKNYSQAAKWYGKLIKETPEYNAEDYFYYGVYTYFSGKYADAQTIFKDMAAKYPKESSPIYWQGRSAAAQDEEAKTGLAVPYYKQWLDMNTEGVKKSNKDLMQAYQYLAIYYYNSKNNSEAKNYCNQILQLEPDNKTAKQILDILK